MHWQRIQAKIQALTYQKMYTKKQPVCLQAEHLL